jgi:hypothetical protein
MSGFSEARVATEAPRRCMTQLCKHWEHKLRVTFDETSGSITFGSGICTLRAEEDALVLRVTGDVESLEGVVARHLLRFMFRAPPEIIWERHTETPEP